MNYRYFNSKVLPAISHQWAANILSMTVNPNDKNGPDLLGDGRNVEMKNSNKGKKWTISNRQVRYDRKIPCFLLLVQYDMDHPVKTIRRTEDIRDIEAMITQRTGYVVAWDWVRDLPRSRCRTDTYRYAAFDRLPGIVAQRDVPKGKLYFTEGVDPKYFGL
jgi:hypothetical protein